MKYCSCTALLLWSLSCLPTCSPGLIFTTPELMIVGTLERRTKMVLVSFISFPLSFNEVCFTGIKFGVCTNGVWCIWRGRCRDCLYHTALELISLFVHFVKVAQKHYVEAITVIRWTDPKLFVPLLIYTPKHINKGQTFKNARTPL